MRITLVAIVLGLFVQIAPAEELKVGIIGDGFPGQEPAQTAAMMHAISPIAPNPKLISPDQLDPRHDIHVDLLVVPSACSIPTGFIPAIDRFLKSGGRLIACGLPLGSLGVFKAGDKWMTRADYDRAIEQLQPQKMLMRFTSGNVKKLERSSDNLNHPITVESIEENGKPALRVQIPKLTGWDTLNISFDHPFAPAQTYTCFGAKGSDHTHQLAIEWQETDGSRWIATVPLTNEWKNYAIPPSAFAPWQPPKGRGGPGDALNPKNARRFAVGLAFSHTDFERGPHEYFLADLGTARAPFDALPDTSQLPHIDGLCPDYQFFPIHSATRLRTPTSQPIVTATELDALANLLALHPRPGGAGFNKHRKWRWQPLLEAYDGDEYRGAIATLIVPLQQQKPAALAVFTPTDPAFYQQPKIQQILTDTAYAMTRGVFLAEGGADRYTSDATSVQLGAAVVRLANSDSTNLTVRTSISSSHALWYHREQTVHPVATSVESFPGERFDLVPTSWDSPKAFPNDPYRVVVELLDNGKPIDRLEHALYQYQLPANPHFIQTRNGQFIRYAMPWKVNGVNYMPSSGIGLSLEDGGLFEQWMGAASYDPAIVGRDLARVKKMNLNVVSAFIYHESLDAGNLLDFLRQCEALDLKVNLALRPGTPMDFEWEKMREIIKTSKLAQSDVVFAYDLAWEPSHNDSAYQQAHYGKKWQSWVFKKYGGLVKAFLTWGFTPITVKDHIPSDLHVPDGVEWTTNGRWTKFVLDYRDFCNELLATNYGQARDLIRSIDPHHLVSFRMTDTGNPTANDPGRLCFDFYGLKDAVDLWEPEAYGRIGDWMRVRDGRFESAYARLCNPNLPLMWAEVGLSVWDRAAREPNGHRLDFQAQFARDMYRVATESGDDGLIWWWYPGGYRTNEQSDFGILNPDGTDRPISKVIRDQGSLFLKAPKPGKPDLLIPISRNQDARGIFGIYEATKDAFWKAIDDGKNPGLKWDHK